MTFGTERSSLGAASEHTFYAPSFSRPDFSYYVQEDLALRAQCVRDLHADSTAEIFGTHERAYLSSKQEPAIQVSLRNITGIKPFVEVMFVSIRNARLKQVLVESRSHVEK